MKNINKEKLKNYIIEIIRGGINIVVVYFLNYFISSLPFLSNLNIFNEKIYLFEFITFLMMIISCFIIYEFAKRTRSIVDEMMLFIPSSGKIHSYSVYLILIIVAYFSANTIFIKFFGEEWIWAYNLFFIAFSLYFVAKIFVIFYQNSHSISSNIFDMFFHQPKE
jgi:hypothetical protein